MRFHRSDAATPPSDEGPAGSPVLRARWLMIVLLFLGPLRPMAEFHTAGGSAVSGPGPTGRNS